MFMTFKNCRDIRFFTCIKTSEYEYSWHLKTSQEIGCLWLLKNANNVLIYNSWHLQMTSGVVEYPSRILHNSRCHVHIIKSLQNRKRKLFCYVFLLYQLPKTWNIINQIDIFIKRTKYNLQNSIKKKFLHLDVKETLVN